MSGKEPKVVVQRKGLSTAPNSHRQVAKSKKEKKGHLGKKEKKKNKNRLLALAAKGNCRLAQGGKKNWGQKKSGERAPLIKNKTPRAYYFTKKSDHALRRRRTSISPVGNGKRHRKGQYVKRPEKNSKTYHKLHRL